MFQAALNASPVNSLATYSGLSGLQATNQTPLVSMLNTQVSGNAGLLKINCGTLSRVCACTVTSSIVHC